MSKSGAPDRTYFVANAGDDTKGIGIEHVADDGTKRSMVLLRNSTGYCVRIETHYAGEAESIGTVLSLSAQGVEMLTQLLSGVHHMDRLCGPVTP